MIDDELLSAYVDGELSGAELAAVESRLRDDPAARTLVAELRAVSATLRALPRHKVDVDLRELVLQQPMVHRKPVLEDEGDGAGRRWVWAVMAIAATFFLAVYMPQTQQDPQQVAQAGAKERKIEQAGPRLVGAARSPLDGAELVARSDSPPGVLDFREGDATAESVSNGSVLDENLEAGRQVLGSTEVPQQFAYSDPLQIHLLPAAPHVGLADFDKLLASHGIALRGKSSGIAGGGAEAASSADRLNRSSTAEPAVAKPELVWVEAPPADIQKLLAAVAGAGSPWRSRRDGAREDSESSFSPFEGAAAASGVAVALESLNLPDETEAAESASAAAPLSDSAPVRGWATHLGHGETAAIAEKPADDAVDRQRGPSELPATTMRVLFILHPAAE